MKAGYDAYYAAESGGYFGANFKPHSRTPPYTKNPQRSQWMKGWQIAQKNHGTGGNFSYDPFVGMDLGYLGKDHVADRQAKQREFQRKQAEFKAKQKQKVVPASRPEPAVSLRRLDKFNKKHRTKV